MSFEVASDRLWQFSSILALVLLGSGSPGTIRRVRAMRLLPDFNPVAGFFMFMLMIVFFGAMGLGASGFFSSFAVYLVAICSLLTTSGIMFGLVVDTILSSRQRVDSED